MAPNLANSTFVLIRDMISSDELKGFIWRYWQSYAEIRVGDLITSLTGVLTRSEQGSKAQEVISKTQVSILKICSTR